MVAKSKRLGNSYYREYFVPTKEMTGTGPERLIVGEMGELYYTSNHYGSFLDLVNLKTLQF